jgi:hypothetical protein
MAKHKTTIEKNPAFAFKKPFSTNLPEFKSIEKPKEVLKKTKSLNKNTKILEFLFDHKIDNNNNNKSNPNNNNNSQDIFDPKNIEYSTLIIPSPQILVSDSQVIVLSSASSFHSFPYIASPTSLTIHSSIVDSNNSIQALNMLKTFELVPTPSLPLTPPLSPILTEKTINTNVNSTTLQKNQ